MGQEMAKKYFLFSNFKKHWKKYRRITSHWIENEIWPSTLNSLILLFIIFLVLILGEPEFSRYGSQALWDTSHKLINQGASPRWVRGLVLSGISSLVTFILIVKLRQFAIKCLLMYKGWLYERRPSKQTMLWGLSLKILMCGAKAKLYSYQRVLPRLSVPPLELTLKRLIDSMKPLVTKEELQTLQKESDEFAQNIGWKLQIFLKLKSWIYSNYVSDWWEKYAYLRNRDPLVNTSNYYGTPQGNFLPTTKRLVRAATATHLTLKTHRKHEDESFPPLVLRETVPLCMNQNHRILSCTRIPGLETDSLKHCPDSRHLIISYKGFFFKMEAYDAKDQILSPLTILAELEKIIKEVDNELETKNVSDAYRSFAALTGLPRTKWAEIRNHHFMEGLNSESLEDIESSIVMIIISEEPSPETLSSRGKALMHGDGKTYWFDKSVNMVFFHGGRSGGNLEHTSCDAPVLCQFWEAGITEENIERWYTDEGDCFPPPKNFKQANYKPTKRLDWNLNPDLEKDIIDAVKFAEKHNSELDMEVIDHDAWGKGLIKKCGISPDAFVQAALQVAYYKDSNGEIPHTYEAGMTRFFLNGRTETVRSCTKEMGEFIRAMDNGATKAEKIRLLKVAADKHTELVRDSMTGNGIDRHLFALYIAAKGFNYDVPFLEKVLGKPWVLSTSQSPQQLLERTTNLDLPYFKNHISPGGGFAPVSPEGYGVAYMMGADTKLFFHVSSRTSCKKTCSKRYVENIVKTLDEMRSLFDIDIHGNKIES